MRNYLGIWTLLAAGLFIMVLLSCFDHVSVMGFEVKSSGIAERLTRKKNILPVVATDNAATTGPAVAMKPDKIETDTASQRILIIGDSMLEGINPRLAAYAKENGHTLNSVIWYSSTTEYWGACDTLGVFLRRFNPTFIFISLGGNELFVRNIAEQRDKYVKSILRQIGDIPYLWIGPPNWKKDTGINKLIADNVPQGCFFRSDGMKFDRQKDGAHPTHASAALWVDSIARWMPEHGAHPIKMNKPVKAKSRPESVTVLQPLR